ncbi:MAG: carbohydrate kinase family protein [Thermoplasmata archaeon]|nr:MAG: carbohydrate kinase family protein [Thermoplasmata archaeon]
MAGRNLVAVFGHTNVDHITLVPAFPPMNQSIQIDGFQHLWGGTAANVAVVAARLGTPTALASFVGKGFPHDFMAHLLDSGLDLTDLTFMEDYPTPECFIFSDGDENQLAFVIQGPMEVAQDFDLQTHSIESADVVHLATGNPAYHMRVAEEAKRQGKKVCFDPGQELHYKWDGETFSRMMELSDMLFLNHAELQRALKYTHMTKPRDLLNFIDTLVLTRGREGSTMRTVDDRIDVPMVPATRVEDTTGAGDAFRGGYYAGVNRGMSPEDCLFMGAAVASFVVERQGPQTNIPTFDQAWERALDAGAGRD